MTVSDIQHLTIKLMTLDVGNETEVQATDLTDSAQFKAPVRFSNLRANTTYRVRAFAYGTGEVLLSEPAQSFVDVSVGNNDAPGMANLKMTLIDTPFAGSGALGVQDPQWCGID